MNALRDWLTRAADKFPVREVAPFLFPPTLAAKALRYRAYSGSDRIDGTDVSARDPEFVRVVVDAFRAVGEKYFRWQVEGINHVPADGSALLVGNHNGGMQITDTFLTFVAIWDRFGPERVVNGLAHDLAFHDPVLAKYALQFGALRAGHDAAERALDAGNLLLVYPGSDLDAYRPFRDRHRIVLGGRKGFIRLALRKGVPVVPVVSVGTHEQFVVLTSGRGLARALGLKRQLRSEVLPIVVSIPWGVTLGFLPYVPLPSQTTIAFGPKVTFDERGPAAAADPVVVERCYRVVEERMQALLDKTAEGRKPFIGRPAKNSTFEIRNQSNPNNENSNTDIGAAPPNFARDVARP